MKKNLVILMIMTMLVVMGGIGCPPTTPTPPPYSGGYTDDAQLVISVGPAMGDHTIPLADLRQGSNDDFNRVVIPLEPKTTDSTGRFTSYERESIAILLESLRDDDKLAVLKRPFVQLDAVFPDGERDIRFFGDTSEVEALPGEHPITGAEIVGLLALAHLMGVNINNNNITTYNMSSWCAWPYPYSYYGFGGSRYYQCGPWWYGMKGLDSKSVSDIPPLPIDSTAPAGAITITSDMDKIVIRYGYILPDGSGVQKFLTILLDNDSDGFTNIDEDDAGTDPNDQNDFPVVVPDVVGLNRAQATVALEAVHLVVGTVSTQMSSEPEGEVLSSNPPAGTSVISGTVVDLILSSGITSNVMVPDVRGKTTYEAGTILENANLRIGGVIQEHSATVSMGLVIRSNPIGGASVPTDSAVDLVVSSGPVGQAEVRITNPASGMVYHIGDTVTLTIKVKGATGGGPYSLLIQNGEFTKVVKSITIQLGDLGTEEVEVFPHPTFTFHLISNGSLFMATLFDGPVRVAESDVPYSVQP